MSALKTLLNGTVDIVLPLHHQPFALAADT
eukprot:UN01585